MRTLMALLVIAAMVVGCGRREKPVVPPPAPQSQAPVQPVSASPPAAAKPEHTSVRGTIDQVVDGMTGIQSMRTGQRAKQKIQAINAERQKQMDEAAEME